VGVYVRKIKRKPLITMSGHFRGQRAVRSRVTYFEQVLRHGLLVDFDTV